MQEHDESPTFDDLERVLEAGDFEESLTALRAVVAHLESGGLRLDDAVRSYEVGARLARRCEQLLADAELRISRLDDNIDAEDGTLDLGQ